MKNEKIKESLKNLAEKLRGLSARVNHRVVAVVCAVILIGSAVALNLILINEDATATGDMQMAVDLEGLTDGAGNTSGEAEGESVMDAEARLEDYFATVTLGREQARDEAMEVLLQISEDAGAELSAKEAAISDINRLALEIEMESNIETMVTAKGFDKCVAVINGDSANVIVSCDTLTPGEVAQISEIVYEEAGIVPSNLKIIEKSIEG